MKILTFTSLFPNQIQPVLGVFVQQRVAHFARRPGNSVEVISPVPFFPRWLPWRRWRHFAQIPDEEQVRGLRVLHPRYPLLPKVAMPLHGLWMFAGCLRTALRLHRKSHFQCIDAHFIYPDGFAAVLLGKVLGIPVICSARGTDINVYPTYRLIRPQILWTLRHAAGIIAVSAALKFALIRLGAPAEKIRVIGNGVDLERFGPMDRQEARRKLGLLAEGPVLVSVASLQAHKGHQALISAVAEIASKYPQLRLYFLGEGPLRDDLQTLIAQKNLQERVILKGNRPNEELKLWYNAADASCLVSTREGWPNVLLESIGCGTPVVATRVGGVAEVVTTTEVGILVERTPSAIAEGLEAALRKSWDRDAMAQFARKRGWDDVAAEMERYFEECV